MPAQHLSYIAAPSDVGLELLGKRLDFAKYHGTSLLVLRTRDQILGPQQSELLEPRFRGWA